MNLLEAAVGLPNSRIFNNMRLVPIMINIPDVDLAFIWCVSPPNSSFKFFFNTLFLAEQFCRKYSFKHKDSFWSKVFCPLFSYDFCYRNFNIGDLWR